MKQFSKNILVLGVASALTLGTISHSHAATYEVIEVDKDAEAYTYGGKININGEMAVSGTNSYNFPVQFDYLDDTDFNNINYLALTRHDYYYGLEEIEDFDALKAGNPTANDLAWAKLHLQDMNTSTANPYFEYQVVADTAAMINLDATDESITSTQLCIFDTDFSGAPCSGELTRSTVNVIEGINDSGISFGTATAPYLPMEEFTDSSGNIRQFWLREHGQRGFYSIDNGQTIKPVTPIYSDPAYGGGISALFDMNEIGTAVGYSSYKLSEGREEDVLDPTNGCVEPNKFNVPYEICIQYHQAGMYHIQAFKATISATGDLENTEGLGLLITPHPDDTRAFTSQALAVNSHGTAVGFAHGWDDTDVTTPTADERMTGSYAVIFKEDEAGNKKVFDFNQPHYYFNAGYIYPFSMAHDINDAGLVVGFSQDVTNFVKKFFYVDSSVAESEMEIVIPKGFFKSSVSTAYAVNSDGIIVGEAQIETHNESSQNPRRTAGFMYDTSVESPTMIDVNTLLACDSPYNVLKASDINDAGQISATAIVKSESYDAKGDLILDESGNAVMVDVARAVLLNPITDGVIEDCGLTEDKVERQGASFGAMGLFSLLTLFSLRRRRFTK